jgi:pimeloyl-ACP methyl ester carboxylesterase
VQVTRNKPCLVIHGQDDQILPIAAAQELANLVNAPLQDISVASHLLMMEQPDKVASILLEFIVEKCI